jgi:hypothetical protein
VIRDAWSGIDFDPRPHWERTAEYQARANAAFGKETQMPPTQPTGITKIWSFFKSSFIDRPNDVLGSGLTAFKAEWDELDEKGKADLRRGIDTEGTLTY